MNDRNPAIVHQVADAHDYPARIVSNLQDLASRTPDSPIDIEFRPGGDSDYWNQVLEPWRGRRWFDPTFLWCENLFYRLLLETVEYFDDGEWQGVDPFSAKKLPAWNEAMRTSTARRDGQLVACLLYTSPSPRDATLSRMPSSA